MADERFTCACAKGFDPNAKQQEFDTNPEGLIISAAYDVVEDKIFVNAN